MRNMLSATPTAISVTVSNSSLTFGQAETLTATISVPAGDASPNEGFVTFYDGTTSVGYVPVANGLASVTTSALAEGANAITAAYSDTGNYAPSTSGIEATSTETILPISGLSLPSDVVVDGEGDVFVADAATNQVVELTASGTQKTVISGLDDPAALAINSAGDLFISQDGNNTLIEVTPSGNETTLDSALNSPGGLAFDSAGDLFVADPFDLRVVELPVSGSPTTVVSGLNNPGDVAVDNSGDLFITIAGTNDSVLEVTPSGRQTTVASAFAITTVAVDNSLTGDVFFTQEPGGEITELTPVGTQTAVVSGLGAPDGLTVDSAGDLFVCVVASREVMEVKPGVPVTVSASPTTTSLTASVSSPSFSQSETFTATVSGAPAIATPGAGTVTFYDGTVALGTCARLGWNGHVHDVSPGHWLSDDRRVLQWHGGIRGQPGGCDGSGQPGADHHQP